MRIEQTREQQIKSGLHFAQALLIFIAACLTLAVMTKAGGTGGATGYYFAMCFLSIPALIYQVMVPMWTRAWRFANVYAYAAIDILYAILWFAASIAVAVWNGQHVPSPTSNGKRGLTMKTSALLARDGDGDDREDGHNAAPALACGDATRCGISKASVGFGIIISLLFVATAVLAVRAVAEYKRTGKVPRRTTTVQQNRHDQDPNKDPNKDPWSTNTDELDEEGLLHEDGHGYRPTTFGAGDVAYQNGYHQDPAGAPGNNTAYPSGDYSYRGV